MFKQKCSEEEVSSIAKTTGLSADQLRAKIDQEKAAGKTESTSKSLGKYVDALKVLTPDKYGAETVQFAKNKLASSTQPLNANGANGVGNPNDIQSQIDAKKDALVTAQAGINDNPFYSEATRVGKSARLNSVAQQEIGNLQDSLNQQQKQQQLDQQAATPKTQVIQGTDEQGNTTAVVINTQTGAIVSKTSLGKINKSSPTKTTKTGTPKAGQVDPTVKADTSAALDAVRGTDGFVAPMDYINAKRYFVSQGGNAVDFDKNYRSYINPTHSGDYLGA